MDPSTTVHLVVGILLICGSVGMSIAAVVQGRKVQTWTPFIWSAVIGILLVPSSVLSVTGPGDIRLILSLVGGLMLLGSLGTAMLISISGRPVKTWTPLVWGTIIGLLLL